MNSSFLNRWSFSYLKCTKYVTNIIAEPKYKCGQQEQVTVRNHNRIPLSMNLCSQLNSMIRRCRCPSWVFAGRTLILLNVSCRGSKVNKQKRKKDTISCHLFPFCLIPIFKHVRTDFTGKREREGQRGLPLLKLFWISVTLNRPCAVNFVYNNENKTRKKEMR